MYRVTVLVCGALLLATSMRPQQASPPRLLAECPRETRACVRMLLHATDLPSIRKSQTSEDSIGYSVLRLAVPARQGGEAVRQLDVTVRAFTGGMQCSVFGQATVAVIGFSEANEPILLTTGGPLVVENRALTVGCEDCLRVAGTTTKYRSPSWDLMLTGHRSTAFAFLDSGEPVLRTQDGCVVMTGRFRFLLNASCVAQLSSSLKPDVETGACT